MASNALPPTPDFPAVEAAAPRYAERQHQILLLVGSLGLNWSNNESMFIYVLMLLLDVDQVDAAVIFSTLNTTRARLDLVRRLAAIKIRDRAVAQTLQRLIKRFETNTKLRNEFNHCTYRLNERGEITHTHLMRAQEDGGRFSLGEPRAMDDARVAEIADANRQLKRLNRDLWDFLPRLRDALSGAISPQSGKS